MEASMNARSALLVLLMVYLADGPALARRTPKPDLHVTSLRVIGPVEASIEVDITVRNSGAAAAAPFATEAFMTTPTRYPLLFTLCPLTRAQQAAGGSAPCASPFTGDPLAPGATASYTAYVTWPVNHTPGTRERVDFVADGCFAPLEPSLPAFCRVDETNEHNNSRSATLPVP
jgi:hypothetical protein